jgi:alpha/beta superfamily hydrolase
MNASTERITVAGPAGELECAVDRPASAAAEAAGVQGLALVCHPHPLHGGTMDNKVVQTLARAMVQAGWTTVRFNFRGVGRSQGVWDAGVGEIDDACAVLDALRPPGMPLVLAGFSFGAYVASQVGARLGAGAAAGETKPSALRAATHMVLVGPAVQNFEVAAVPAESVVIHGEQDDVVPLGAVLDWARPLGVPIVVVPGAGHFFHGQLPLLKRLAALPGPAK